ncbi:Zn-dependent hydrolase [Bradyrhizobium sp. U87765 SZCCT0131]|uniref:Zn-dependent hydrolase n=1 Tax=unclassified Bradyrhizobium TaxID=2631580 RepID=UPI001BA774CF|nr:MULTISPECIES: Zn-dependent hydrolase [unclassified Bradyrhizobium]MBR1221632.1 Zn-dependent hydrolase [Bradyrhizobium sp. U87765 SZCCT0131]MBR1264445.1 Zn-dependent hydrolase [Bradyrhizobium sp. U87765 SZCCT0134]MBR1304648.1 Zn-dependent hydrolase [Bradyrhizobium sp. U87765 SZCCT0110]MBR1322495.1 Zn-dependent hydrolase [Bradyrhizobium sp. U87765 SZCCT0109]MBR1346577.1 Zn-dependent hydrolase [Bradyrhizobium sp. U87765 SZCCT0048]
MSASRPPIDSDRLWNDVMALGAITDPDRPYTRRSFSARFLEGRQWLRERFEAAGLSVRLDTGANVIARLEGSVPDAPPIMLGSHSDTVPSGGRFDGIAGILTALEAVRALKEAGYTPRHPIEIVDFLAEEPSEYGVSCVGSRAMVGALDAKMLGYTNAKGETLAAAITRVGGDPARFDEARPSAIAGYLELHIEQGTVLESNAIPLGLVTAIVGIVRVEIVFHGAADHAGTTPMAYRHDAAVPAAGLVTAIAARARDIADRGEGHFVATTGVLEISPNAANVVPGGARMIVDIRAEDAAVMDDFATWLDQESQAIAIRTGVARASFSVLSRNLPSPCDAHLRDVLQRAADKLGHSTMSLASGAGHDAAFVSRIGPSAMLFIPCREGKSHCPEEWAEPEALATGAATLFEAIRLLDGQNT